MSKNVILTVFYTVSINVHNLNDSSDNINDEFDVFVVMVQNSCSDCQMFSLKYVSIVVCFVMKSHDDMKMELECQNLDSEFGLFGCREDQKTTPDRPGWKMFWRLFLFDLKSVLNFIFWIFLLWLLYSVWQHVCDLMDICCCDIVWLVTATYCSMFIVVFQIFVHSYPLTMTVRFQRLQQETGIRCLVMSGTCLPCSPSATVNSRLYCLGCRTVSTDSFSTVSWHWHCKVVLQQ